MQKVDFAQRQLKEAERINTKVTADYVKGQEDIDALKKQLRTVDQLRERAKALADEVRVWVSLCVLVNFDSIIVSVGCSNKRWCAVESSVRLCGT